MRGAMAVPVVQIGVVRMPMHQARMAMPVGMRLAEWVGRFVLVLVVRIVAMAVLVLHRFMHMLVLVLFGQVQPDAERHQRAGDE